MLGGTLTATFLALSDARPDLATLAAVGAAPRTRRGVAASYALVVGFVGAVLGALVGFIPGVAITFPLTSMPRGARLTGEACGPYLDIPWLLILGLVVALPLLTAAHRRADRPVPAAAGGPAGLTVTGALPCRSVNAEPGTLGERWIEARLPRPGTAWSARGSGLRQSAPVRRTPGCQGAGVDRPGVFCRGARARRDAAATGRDAGDPVQTPGKDRSSGRRQCRTPAKQAGAARACVYPGARLAVVGRWARRPARTPRAAPDRAPRADGTRARRGARRGRPVARERPRSGDWPASGRRRPADASGDVPACSSPNRSATSDSIRTSSSTWTRSGGPPG